MTNVIIDGQQYVQVVDRSAWDILAYSLAQVQGEVDTISYLAQKSAQKSEFTAPVRRLRNLTTLYGLLATEDRVLRQMNWGYLPESVDELIGEAARDTLLRLSSNCGRLLSQYGDCGQWDKQSNALEWIQVHLIPVKVMGFYGVWRDSSQQNLFRIVIAELLENALKYSDPTSGEPIVLEWHDDYHKIYCTNPLSRDAGGNRQGEKILKELARKIGGDCSFCWGNSDAKEFVATFSFPKKSVNPQKSSN